MISLSLSGDDGRNYVLSSNSYSDHIGTITQLASVNYVGPNGGLWSISTNWAGGAIPTRDNVANVYIPSGTSVIYDVAKVTDLGALTKGGAGFAMTSNIINHGMVTINESSATELPNTLSGSGVFSQMGLGALTISGNNSQTTPGPFTGQFSIGNNSTLMLSNINALGSGNIISNNGKLGLSSDLTLPSLSVAGPVTLVSGIQTLGDQIYGGPVTIGYGGQSSDGAMRITSQDANITFNGALNSDGADRSLTISAGAGTVTFNDTVGYISPDRNHKSADIYGLLVNAAHINLLQTSIRSINSL